jgi:DNA-binding NarL/FixJ family response regulator
MPKLSPRERQVLEGVSRGLTAKEIAKELGTATRTVENQRRTAYDKLGFQGKPIMKTILEALNHAS